MENKMICENYDGDWTAVFEEDCEEYIAMIMSDTSRYFFVGGG
jgi:hypothetical protein